MLTNENSLKTKKEVDGVSVDRFSMIMSMYNEKIRAVDKHGGDAETIENPSKL